MPVCEFCGSQNLAGAGSCGNCGQSLSDGKAAQIGDQSTPQHVLIAEKSLLVGKRFLITATGIQIGRHPGMNQVVFDDEEVSRLHARIYLNAEGHVHLEDSSMNGTYVNERREQRAALQPGDRIRFGFNPTSVLVYRVELPRLEPVPCPPLPHPEEASLVGWRTIPEQGAGRRLQLVLDHEYVVKDFPIATPIIELGRNPGSSGIRIEHSTVCDRHAKLTIVAQGVEKGRVRLEDLNSTEGTFVNSRRVEQCLLSDGDLIQLGTCESRILLYREPQGRPVALRQIDLNRPVNTLGRDPSNHVHLPHPTLSRFHAEIHKRDSTFEIVDRDSANGTYVNGMRIRRQVLQLHDRISVGGIQLEFDGHGIEGFCDSAGVRLGARGLGRTAPDSRTGHPVTLLDSISLVVEPREFVGLLGPAGSGKTTLMHALNGFHPADQGEVLLNGRNFYREFASLRAAVGYVPQEDVLHRALTVRECLYYAARLRLPDDHGEKEIWDEVFKVMKILDLSERADLAIERLSGGQRKRVSLGIELLSRPGLLFLDEPNAGQDPRTEIRLMQLFRQIANEGSTVILTTHLLGSFSLLDKVAVMVHGRLAYFGPSQQMLDYFGVRRPQDTYDRLQEKAPEQWAKDFQSSSIYRDCLANPLGLNGKSSQKTPGPPAPVPLPVSKPTPTPERSKLRQLSTLLSRQMALKLKETKTVAGLLLPPPLIALLMGLLLHDRANDPKALFITVIVALWFGCSASVREIVDERAIYERERQGNLTIPAYLASKLIYLSGLAALQTFLFIGVATLAGVQKEHFFAAWALIWLLTLHGALIGLLISATASNPEKALYLFPLALIPQLLLAGLFVPVSKVPQHFDPRPKAFEFNCVQPGDPPHTMGRFLGSWISPLIVGRWGLEAFADLYLHDYKFGPGQPAGDYPYSLWIIRSVSVTLHKDEAEDACQYLKSLTTPDRRMGQGPAAGYYACILVGYALVMISLVTWAMKRKDKAR